jgi:hypothetical protein
MCRETKTIGKTKQENENFPAKKHIIFPFIVLRCVPLCIRGVEQEKSFCFVFGFLMITLYGRPLPLDTPLHLQLFSP